MECGQCLHFKSCGKGKIACNNKFSVSHGVFYPFTELSAISAISIKFEIAHCKLVEESKICHLRKG